MLPQHHHDILRGLAIIHRHAAFVPQFVAVASAPDAYAAFAQVRTELQRSLELVAPPQITTPTCPATQRLVA